MRQALPPFSLNWKACQSRLEEMAMLVLRRGRSRQDDAGRYGEAGHGTEDKLGEDGLAA